MSVEQITTRPLASAECNLVKKKEELVIDKKPYPGLEVFNYSNSLTFFSEETILELKLGSTSTNHCEDSQNGCTVMLVLANDPELAFYLMGVSLKEDLAEICLNIWQQHPDSTVSVYDVIRVFLNWGATLESLGFGDDQQQHPSSCFIPTLSPTSLPNFPAPHNINAILASVSDHLSFEGNEDADKQRFDLVRILMWASLDDRLRQHRFKFNQAIYKVLETFPDWTSNKVSALIEHLNLSRMGLQNAAYVCCSFFHSISSRVQDFKVMSIRHLLHSRFSLLPPHEPFSDLLEHLFPVEMIVERFQMLEIYILVQLVNSLLVICYNTNPSCSMKFIEALGNWAQTVHSTLMAHKFLYNIESGFVRDKCMRLQADCVELTRNESMGKSENLGL